VSFVFLLLILRSAVNVQLALTHKYLLLMDLKRKEEEEILMGRTFPSSFR
jgi:hypothetical protein